MIVLSWRIFETFYIFSNEFPSQFYEHIRLPVHNVSHIVVAHFCQFENILDDKPAHGVDDDDDDAGAAAFDDDGGGGEHDESIL